MIYHNHGLARRGPAWRPQARLGIASQGNVRVPGYEQKLPTLQSWPGQVRIGKAVCAKVRCGRARTILSMIRNCLFTVKARTGMVSLGLAWPGEPRQGKEYLCIKK